MRPTTESSVPKIQEELARFADQGNLSEVKITFGNHHAINDPGCSPGSDDLFQAAHELRGSPWNDPTTTVIAASNHTTQKLNGEYARALGINNISLPRMLEYLPELDNVLSSNPRISDLSLETIMKYHAEVVHFGRYLASHDQAFSQAFENSAVRKNRLMQRLLSPERLEAAAAIDGAIAQFMLNSRMFEQDLSILSDWPAALSVSGLYGSPIRHDIISNHGVVPSLKSILEQPDPLMEYQLRVFETMARAANVTVLHTENDADNLTAISDYLGIPYYDRAALFVRNMIPSCFTDLNPKETITPHPLIQEAAAAGKFIAVIAERLDFIKMDPALMRGLLQVMEQAGGDPDLAAKLRQTRIAFIAVPSEFARDEDSGLYSLYSGYNHTVERLIRDVNSRYREVTGEDQDFIMANRDENDVICGMDRDTLRTQIYPFARLAVQMGHEGLCLSVQEPALVRAYKRVPYPVVQLVSRGVGYSEKAENAGLLNVVICPDSTDPAESAKSFRGALDLAFQVRNGEREFRTALVEDIKNYYRSLGSSYFGEALELLNDKINEQTCLRG